MLLLSLWESNNKGGLQIMKKIDLHIHTKTSPLDENTFEFNVDILKKYVCDLSIDAIAITNHNLFDKNQFDEIFNELKSTIVFPGIEVSLEGGHILVIAPTQKLTEFVKECQLVEDLFKNQNFTSLSLEQFLKCFTNLQDYLVIPHYEKSPRIPDSVINQLKTYIFCGEVPSPKKFEYCAKDKNKLTPVLFSDFRRYDYDPDPKKGKTFPIRQTYVDCNNLSLNSIKLALRDKAKVSLSPISFARTFQILQDGTLASTGINVILGSRSSGKTYTLDTIRNTFDQNTVEYIKQFSLVDKNDEDKFKETISREKSDFSVQYLECLKRLVDKAINIDLSDEKAGISRYISSLISFAKGQDKNDAFSKAKLFSDTLIPKEETDELKSLISALTLIIENQTYKEIIARSLDLEKLKNLFIELNSIYEKKKLANIIIDETNNVISSIKRELGQKSAVTTPEDWSFISYLKKKLFVDEFNKLIGTLTSEKIICDEKVFNSYRIVGKCHRIRNVTELKAQFSNGQKPNIEASEFEQQKQPYDLLRFLIDKDRFKSKNDAYKIFWRIDYDVLNSFGTSLSGGEKAEYNLLAKLRDSRKYDVILIDEPESSFDNPYLRTNVIQIIKDLAVKSTIFLVTHNNNLGVLIKPDRIFYTEKQVSANPIQYRIYSGNYDDKELKTADGNKVLNYTALIKSMEAGEDAYNERRKIYEDIKNN